MYARLFENFENTGKPEECKLIGSIPSWLKGTVVRNGPGMFKIGNTEYKHWWDGLAYIQRYHFVDGKMFYSARFLESEDYKDNMEAKRIVATSFGTRTFSDPTKSWLISLLKLDIYPDNCLVSFAKVGDSTYALTESVYMFRIEIDTLDTLEKVDIRDYISSNLHVYSAHFHADASGNLYNIGTIFGKSSCYVLTKTTNPLAIKGAKSSHSFEGTEVLGVVPASEPRAPCYFHSFGLSRNYFILFETPQRTNVMKLCFRKFRGISFNDCMYWDEKAVTNVILFDRIRRTRVERKITADPFFVFHHSNSYEKDGYLIVDYCKVFHTSNMNELLLDHLRTGAFRAKGTSLLPFLCRMIIPINVSSSSKPGDDLLANCSFAGGCRAVLNEDGSIHCYDAKMSDVSMEFPIYRYDRNSKEYRYVYGSCFIDPDNIREGVVKIDLRNVSSKVWYKDAVDQIAAEPVFVSKPGAAREDEGVLVVPVVTSRAGDQPYVVVIDAETMVEMGRFLIPQERIPLGFHAQYNPRSSS
ncbi:retinal pigment epithelial membrane protein [Ancylostoma caninum]|uniref:Retinal pigment epithelial membrane protein n=1 Tax=Ancylostoma caninum TaxID=29170 RepID=A0A368H4H4_ANCCA|nr:retinal pigment epithelial membrane protein [Ancylostoma caninum]